MRALLIASAALALAGCTDDHSRASGLIERVRGADDEAKPVTRGLNLTAGGYVISIGPAVQSDPDIVNRIAAPVFVASVAKDAKDAWLSCTVSDAAGLAGGGGMSSLADKMGGTMKFELSRPITKGKLACFVVPR